MAMAEIEPRAVIKSMKSTFTSVVWFWDVLAHTPKSSHGGFRKGWDRNDRQGR